MRDILFKAKRIDNGEWVYWNIFGELCRESGKRTRISIKKDATTSYYDYIYQIITLIDKNTICQYTGLTDKNGNKIWEHDIVKGTFFGFLMPEENYVGEICWQENISGWGSNYWDSDIEVIGNIFDNPELMKGSDEDDKKIG